MEQVAQYPLLIEIKPFEMGYTVRSDTTVTYYQSLENLAKAIYPSVRHPLNTDNACAGSC